MRQFLVNSLRIKNYNVNELRAMAHDFMDQLRRPEDDNRLGLFGTSLSWNTREKLYRVEEIDQAFKQLLSKLYSVNIADIYIHVTTVDLSPLAITGTIPVDGLATSVLNNGKLDYFVVLDAHSLEEIGQNQFAHWRVLKAIYLHEISHTLLNHPGFTFFQGQQMQQGCQNHQKEDDECDILSYVLAFWPFERFQKLVDEVFNQWGTKNIRLDIANIYKMPINSVVQWMVIMLSDPSRYEYWLHYAWLSANADVGSRNVEPGEILDCYDCRDVLESLYPSENEVLQAVFDREGKENAEKYAAKRLFIKDTSAREALQTCMDSPGRIHETCKCVAFYDKREFLYNRGSDEVVVLGLAQRQV